MTNLPEQEVSTSRIAASHYANGQQSTEDSKILNKDYLGGPRHLFERAGREQLIILLEYGLSFNSYLMDVGCGCLRGARWTIPLLDRGHYCGIDPQENMVSKGLKQYVDPAIVALKEPRFDYNDRFDFSMFNQKFTHFIARSIWSHASKGQIEQMLDGVAAWGEPGAVMLTSYFPTLLFRRKDYKGDRWVGESHESEEDGVIAHDFGWILRASKKRGLEARLVRRAPLAGQHWIAVRKPE